MSKARTLRVTFNEQDKTFTARIYPVHPDEVKHNQTALLLEIAGRLISRARSSIIDQEAENDKQA